MTVEAPDVVSDAEQAREQELSPLIILENLERYLAERLPADEQTIELERIGEGHSNITFLVTRGDHRCVLRGRHARRCRRRHTTCCGSGACSTPSRTPTCARRARCSPATTRA